MLKTLLTLLLLLGLALGPAAANPEPEEILFFTFSSGGAHHPEGHGEWLFTLNDGPWVEITHRVGEDVTEYGDFKIDSEDYIALWRLIDAVDVLALEPSTRPGIPDEPTFTFNLERGDGSHVVDLWSGDARENPDIVALVDAIGVTIESCTGVTPVGRAAALHAAGRRFESAHLHQQRRALHPVPRRKPR
jgi:hypothetical protein